MKSLRWGRWDRLNRALHLYTGLFLVPWMTIYAVSAFCLNHSDWFENKLDLRPKWELVQETDFVPDEGFPSDPKEQARAILKHLELGGAHFILGEPTPSQMTLFRYCGTGHYKITWQREQARLVVEQQKPFSFYSFVNAMHFQRGYTPYFASLMWAIIVDVVTISTVTWVITGIYLWARRPRKRLVGGVSLIAGCLVFAGLAVLLCR